MYVVLDFILIFFLLSALVLLPALFQLLWGSILVRFKKTRNLGVKLLAESMLAPRLTSLYCTKNCLTTPCQYWHCENHYHNCSMKD